MDMEGNIVGRLEFEDAAAVSATSAPTTDAMKSSMEKSPSDSESHMGNDDCNDYVVHAFH